MVRKGVVALGGGGEGGSQKFVMPGGSNRIFFKQANVKISKNPYKDDLHNGTLERTPRQKRVEKTRMGRRRKGVLNGSPILPENAMGWKGS